MDRPNSVSKLRAPTKFGSTQNVLKEIPTNHSKTTADIPSAAVRRVNARRSKSFCFTTTRSTIKLPASKLKPCISTTNLTRIKATNPIAVRNLGATGIRPTAAAASTTSRFNVGPITRTAVKRPATTAPCTTTSNGPSKASAPTAPKLSKFDFKGRFNLLDEKHKALIAQHKETKAELSKLQEESKTFTDTISEQRAELQHLQSELEKLKKECATYKDKSQKFEIQNNQLNKELSEALQSICDYQRNLKESQEQGRVLDIQVHAHKRTIQDTTCENSRLKEDQENALKTISELKETLRTNEDLRRVLHNQVQDLKGTIRVFCRVRPMTASEDDKLPCNMNYPDETTLVIKKSKESISSISGKAMEARAEFNFDRVFGDDSSQAEVFEDLAQLVQSTLDGYNVCVFAYGQTGSGKTFTMLGNEENVGMIPRSIDLLFDRIQALEKCGWMYEVQVNFMEIYNETIKDLLNPNSNKPHDILFNEGKGSMVTNLRTETVATAGIVKKMMALANRNRAVAATDFNLHSSRSHAVTKISVRGYYEHNEFNGSLNLVDLAGSESAKNSDRMTETKSINKSLSTLGTVMLSLHNKDAHIPYRNSKLTYLLQSCLGGNSKTLMFVNISPLEDCYSETINSLRFASKVKEVKTGSKRNKSYK